MRRAVLWLTSLLLVFTTIPALAQVPPTANGVVYTVDLKGVLNAYEATTGALLRAAPLWEATGGEPPLSWGGVSFARNTVYAAAGITGLENGYVVAFRPQDAYESGAAAETTGSGPTDPQILTGPAAKFYGYTTPAMVVEKGGVLTLTNVDLERHDVVHDTETDGFGGPKKMPWCEADEHGHEHGDPCPVFWSKLIGLGQTTRVLGLQNVEPGEIYTFYCTLHHGMKGKLIVR